MIAMNPINEVILEFWQRRHQNRDYLGRFAKKIYLKIKELGLRYSMYLGSTIGVKAVEAVRTSDRIRNRNQAVWYTGPESTNMILIPLVCDMVMCRFWRRRIAPPRIPGGLGSRCQAALNRSWLIRRSPVYGTWKEDY